MKKQYELPCNIAQTLNIIGDRWSMLIIHELITGPKTYKEIQEKLSGIASNLLTTRLKKLTNEGIIEMVQYSVHPPRYSYTITKKGKDLENIFNSLILWGRKYLDTCYKTIVDKNTGDEVEICYYNPKEEKILTLDEIQIVESE